jgi:hypothetical protein
MFNEAATDFPLLSDDSHRSAGRARTPPEELVCSVGYASCAKLTIPSSFPAMTGRFIRDPACLLCLIDRPDESWRHKQRGQRSSNKLDGLWQLQCDGVVVFDLGDFRSPEF